MFEDGVIAVDGASNHVVFTADVLLAVADVIIGEVAELPSLLLGNVSIGLDIQDQLKGPNDL